MNNEMLICRIFEIDGDIVVISDLQPSVNFNITGFKQCIEDLRRKLQEERNVEAIVFLGDIIENMDMYYQQSFISFDLKRQHIFVKHLINELLEAIKPKKIILVAGNHDVARGGEDVSMLLAEYYKMKGYETIWSDEYIILANNYKTYLLAHKLSNAYGSSHVALTPLIRSSAFQFSRWIAEKTMKRVGKLKYGLIIDTVVLGHIHRSAWRFDSMNIITLSGWNRHRWTIAEPSTCMIIYNDGREEILQYPPPLDLTENEIEMRKWVEEVFQQHIKQLIHPKIIEEIKQNNQPENPVEIHKENRKEDCLNPGILENFAEKQYRKYVISDVNDYLFELPWRIEKNSDRPKMIITANNRIPLLVLKNAFNKLRIESKLNEEKLKLELDEDNIMKLLQSEIDDRIKRKILFLLSKIP